MTEPMKCERCDERQATVHLSQVYAGRTRQLHICGECKLPQGWESMQPQLDAMNRPRPGRYLYNDWQLAGSPETLAVNIWNIEMSTRRGNGHDDARNAHDVIMECIIPEVENFVRQQCAKVARDWKAPMPPDFNSMQVMAAADRVDAVIRPIQEGAAKKVGEAILAMEGNRR